MKLGSAWSSPKEMAANCHAMTPTRESEAETQQDYDQKDCRCLAHNPKLAGTAMSVNTNKIAFTGGAKDGTLGRPSMALRHRYRCIIREVPMQSKQQQEAWN